MKRKNDPLDGEKIRDEIYERKCPSELPLGEIVNEIVNNGSVILSVQIRKILGFEGPDVSVVEETYNNRQHILYRELNEREQLYKKFEE